MTGAPGRPRPQRRTQLTGRAAILAVVACALALALAYPVRAYLGQRAEVAELREKVELQRERVVMLRKQENRWQDPAYVKMQARKRLHYVDPGETGYVTVPGRAGRASRGASAGRIPPWFSVLWGSVGKAAEDPRKAELERRTPQHVGSRQPWHPLGAQAFDLGNSALTIAWERAGLPRSARGAP
ncbi:MAG: FtsB family cell division protein, partial [Streptomycetales bacterium]